MAGISQTIWGGGGTDEGTVRQDNSQVQQRDPSAEAQATLQAQLAAAPQEYAAYAQYAPQVAQTDVSTLGKSLFGSNYSGSLTDINQKLTDQSNAQTASSNAALRTANQADVSRLSPQIQAQLRAANPQFYSGIDSQAAAARQGITASPLEGQMRNATNSSVFNPISLNNINAGQVGVNGVNAPRGNSTMLGLQNSYWNQPGMSRTQTMADQTAQNLLSQGGNLSPDELRGVQQASRAGDAARGLDASNSSLVNEVMNTNAAQRARLVQNTGLAESIEGQSQAQREAQQNFGLGLSGQQMGYGQMGLSAAQGNQAASLQAQSTNVGNSLLAQNANNANTLAAQQANLAANGQQYSQLGGLASMDQARQAQNFQMGQQSLANYAGAMFDPQGAVLGQNSANAGMNGSLFGMGASASANNGAVMGNFNPYSAYSSNLYGGNQAATTQSNIASANNKTSQINNVVAADGSTANAVISKI